MASVLKINGSTVNRPAARLVLNRLALSLDGADSLEFTERAVRLPGSFGARAPVVLTVDGTTVFRGVVVGAYPSGIGSGPIDVGYRAVGLEWLADRIPITAADGSGRLGFNLDPMDPDHLPTTAGRSVGQVLKTLFDLHAAALADVAVLGYNALDLAALDVVPPEPVILAGGLWTAVKSLLATWCNKYAAWVDPDSQLIRVQSQLSLAPINLTLDVDPIVVGSLSRDHSECFARVVVRGAADVQAAYRTLLETGIQAAWSAPDQAAWKLADYLQPKGAADVGKVTAMSSTTLTVQSDDPARTWPANFWSGLQAEVVAYDKVGTSLAFSESRRITANAALSAAGTATITVDQPFNNSGYDRYSIRGLSTPMSLVWRKFLVKPSALARRLVKRFSHAVPWSPQDGAVSMTTNPQAVICWSSGGSPPFVEFPATFDVIPYDGTTDGHIVFHEPVVKPFSSQQSLIDGSPDGIPGDIKVLLPYSAGTMSAVKPDAGYEGTSNTVDGSTAVLVVDRPEWLDYRDRANYAKLAQEILDTVKNTVVEGSVTHFGKLSAALTKGRSLNLAHPGHATGLEAVAAPIRSITLDYAPGGGPVPWVTTLSFSNRLRPFTGDKLYAHPAWGARGQLEGARLDMAAAARPPERRGMNREGEAPAEPGTTAGFPPPGTPISRSASGPTPEFVGPPKPPPAKKPEPDKSEWDRAQRDKLRKAKGLPGDDPA